LFIPSLPTNYADFAWVSASNSISTTQLNKQNIGLKSMVAEGFCLPVNASAGV
jgi:hypothetical protein